MTAMKPGKYDLDLYQGDTFRQTFRLRQATWDGTQWVAGAYVDLTGYTGAAEIRSTPAAAAIVTTFDVTILNQTTTLGGVEILLTHTKATLLASASGYVWDLQLTAPNGDVNTFLAGRVNVTQEVTKV